jgi:hypothetical protein
MAWLLIAGVGTVFIFSSESPRVPMVGASDWNITEGFFANGEPRADLPASLVGSPEARFWRSWSPLSGSTNGRLETAPFIISAPAISIPVVGYPAAPGNRIFLKNITSGEIREFVYGNAHEKWQELIIRLPLNWRNVPLVLGAVAGNNSERYLGIGSPSAVGWPSILKHSLPTLIAWHVILLLAVSALAAPVCIFFARLVPRYGSLDAMLMFPLALALIGYFVFFGYQYAPKFLFIALFMLFSTGLILLARPISLAFADPVPAIRRNLPCVLWIMISAFSWIGLNAQTTISIAFAPNYRFTPASWSTDNQIPVIVSEALVAQKLPEVPDLGSWIVGDRPPAYTGLVALLKSVTKKAFSSSADRQDFNWIAHLLGCLVMSSWVFPTWGILKQNRIRVRDRLWVIGILSISPFIFFNTIYAWPKLLSASLTLLGWLLLDPRRPYGASFGFSLCAGLAFGAAMLSHASVFFSFLAIALILLITQLKSRFCYLFICGCVTVLVMLPWKLWVDYSGPPANVLPKYAFTGMLYFNERDVSVKNAVIKSYSNDSFKKWLARKGYTLKQMIGTENSIVSHLNYRMQGANYRYLQFASLFPALGCLLLLVPALFTSQEGSIPTDSHFTSTSLISIGLLTLLIQVILFWSPFMLHEIAYSAVLFIHLGLALAGCKLPSCYRLFVSTGIGMNFLFFWVISPAIEFGNIDLGNFSLYLIVSLLVIALILSRSISSKRYNYLKTSYKV